MKYKLFIGTIIFLLILAPNTLGLGIGPVKTDFLFEPSLEKNFNVNIYNDNNKDLEITIFIDGELSDFISVESEKFYFSSDVNKKSFLFKLSLPKHLDPGNYKSTLKFVARNPDFNKTITTSLLLKHDLLLIVPPHGKYVSLNVSYEFEEINLTIRNIGVKTINHLIINNVFLSESDGFENFHFSDSKNVLLPDEEYFLKIKNLKPGEYIHNLTIMYDNLSKNVKKKIFFGKINVSVNKIFMTDNFRLGDINLLMFELSSNWNKELLLNMEVDVFKEDKLVQSFKTQNFKISDFKEETVVWDTEKLGSGEHHLIIKIYLADDELIGEQTFNLLVEDENLEIETRTSQTLIIPLKLLCLTITIIIYGLILFYLKSKKSLKKKKDLNTLTSDKLK